MVIQAHLARFARNTNPIRQNQESTAISVTSFSTWNTSSRFVQRIVPQRDEVGDHLGGHGNPHGHHLHPHPAATLDGQPAHQQEDDAQGREEGHGVEDEEEPVLWFWLWAIMEVPA
ncbi:ANK_REP_REGION domain-containing protein [Psidium guajava]|nr:ANK_REP_REGION domain-containing protein [Psidium guajava]